MNCVFAPSAPYSAGDIPILGAVKYVPGSTWTNVPERVQAGSLVQGLSFPCARGSGCLWLLSEKFCLTGSSLKMGDASGCAAGFLLQLNWVLEGEEVRSASVHAARQAWSLLPFAGGREEISIPGRRRVFMALTAASSRDLGACARSLSVLLGHWDLPYPPTHPGSFLGLLVWPCLTAAALQLPRPREVQAGRRARCKLHGGLPSPR